MVKVAVVPLTTRGVLEFIDNLVTEVEGALKEAGLVGVEVIAWPDVVKPPMKCFSWDRAQYHANCVVRHLKEVFQVVKATSSTLVIGVGYLDGYEHGLNFVFGEALPGQGVAVVFTKRLRPEFYGEKADYTLYFERLVKETLHELGHLLGLEHCAGSCVMRFSNSVYEVDEKPGHYCDLCRAKMLRYYMSSTK